ncbi:lipocalin-like protein [Chitinophaga dinghuensis]|uniref:Lipocalin-like protein n=1 Tax=Chitinophaga dinghuensis TaxID=1539050 RepID=A0A327VSQ2_9BACT|nr:lipocalin family protein [Chitinophaga dinghuensis]RAJ77397.1 lipocalin-like protein [Chitinophaga dinghuensis]
MQLKFMKSASMKWALIALVSGSILYSCKKEDSQPNNNNNSCEVNVANLVGNYKVTALQYKASANATPVDFLAQMEDCEKDDILTLKTNGTYTFTDAGIVCKPDGNQEGTWKLEGKTLISDGILQGTVSSYNCKTLVYYVENSLADGDKFTFTLTKQ